jgi:hypothetical protein
MREAEHDDDQIEGILRNIAAGDRAAREWLFAQYWPRPAGIVSGKDKAERTFTATPARPRRSGKILCERGVSDL